MYSWLWKKQPGALEKPTFAKLHTKFHTLRAIQIASLPARKTQGLRESTQEAAQKRSRNQVNLLFMRHQNLRQSRAGVISQILCALNVCVWNLLFSLRLLSQPGLF